MSSPNKTKSTIPRRPKTNCAHPRTANDGNASQRRNDAEQTPGDAVHRHFHIPLRRTWIVVHDVAPLDVQREQPVLEARKFHELIVYRRYGIESSGVHDEPREFLHHGTFHTRAEVQVRAQVQPAGAIASDDRQVLLRRLDEVHRRYVGYRLAIGVKEEVQRHAQRAKLRHGQQGRYYAPRVLVVDEDLPRIVVVAVAVAEGFLLVAVGPGAIGRRGGGGVAPPADREHPRDSGQLRRLQGGRCGCHGGCFDVRRSCNL
jgi:hypothetical protein